MHGPRKLDVTWYCIRDSNISLDKLKIHIYTINIRMIIISNTLSYQINVNI